MSLPAEKQTSFIQEFQKLWTQHRVLEIPLLQTGIVSFRAAFVGSASTTLAEAYSKAVQILIALRSDKQESSIS